VPSRFIPVWPALQRLPFNWRRVQKLFLGLFCWRPAASSQQLLLFRSKVLVFLARSQRLDASSFFLSFCSPFCQAKTAPFFRKSVCANREKCLANWSTQTGSSRAGVPGTRGFRVMGWRAGVPGTRGFRVMGWRACPERLSAAMANGHLCLRQELPIRPFLAPQAAAQQSGAA
jgi:hypothetical protein